MTKTGLMHTDNLGVIEACLDCMQSDDPAERIFGRLQRDVLLAYQRERQECAEPAHLTGAVINVITSLLVNVILTGARPGLERDMLSTVLRLIEEHAGDLLAAGLAVRPEAAAATK